MYTTLRYTGQVMSFFTRRNETNDKKRKSLLSGLFEDDDDHHEAHTNNNNTDAIHLRVSTNSTRDRRSSTAGSEVEHHGIGSPTSMIEGSGVIGVSEVNFDVNDLDITNDDFEELISDLDTIDLNAFQQDELVQKAIQEGVDLREYSKHIEDDLRKIETQSIDDYLEESERLADLHVQLQQCDSVLEKMENMLQNFQGSLGNISEEIKTLRDQSFTMNIKKRNRESAQQKLSVFVDKLVVSPDLTRKICDEPVSDSYLEHLLILDEKKDYITAIQNDVKKPIKACDDMLPLLDRLCTKAVSKVRSYLLQQLNELKKPKTNTQFIKQLLLKKKYYYDFAAKHSPQTGEELCAVYEDIIGKYYFNSFKNYVVSLLKLEQKVGTKQSLLVEPTVSLLNNITTMTVINPLQYTTNMLASTVGLGTPNKSGDATKEMNRTVFTLSDRAQVLDNATDLNSPIVARVAIEQNKKFFMEEIFRSVHILLINTATSEYIFSVDFFNNDKMFESLFSKSLQFLKDTWIGFISSTFDCIGLMLMIRLNFMFSSLMEKRNMKCLDIYFDEVHKLLVPKFNEIFEMNLKSVTDTKPEQLVSKEKDSHTLAKRYAELACSIHALNRDNPPKFKQEIEHKLASLREAVTKQLALVSEKMYGTKAKKIQVFLINAYDLILNHFILSKIDVNADGTAISKLLNVQVSAYIEEELTECYAGLISFVKQTEPKLGNVNSKNDGDANKNFIQNRTKVDVAEMEKLAKDFDKNWKQGISHINSNILQNFSNFNTGKEILNKTFTQLLLYYSRFTNIVSACYGDNPPFRSSLITPTKIQYEYKKYIQDFNKD
nr:unnamed protein product [Naegleria fowleri]